MTDDKHELGDAPIESEYALQMQTLAVLLDEAFNGEAKGLDRKTGFVLMVFPFLDDGGTDGRCNYISNGADREDVVKLMKEMISRFEGNPETKGTA